MNLDITFKDKVSFSSKVRARHRFRAWLTIESTLWRGSRCRYTWEPSALTRYSCTSTGLHIGIIWTSRDLIIKIVLRKYCRPSNFQQTLEHSFDDLNQGLYTDVTLVPEDGEGVKNKLPWLYRNFSRAILRWKSTACFYLLPAPSWATSSAQPSLRISSTRWRNCPILDEKDTITLVNLNL